MQGFVPAVQTRTSRGISLNLIEIFKLYDLDLISV